MYGWAPSLFTWSYHNIANQLNANIKIKSLKKEYDRKAKHTLDICLSFPLSPYFSSPPQPSSCLWFFSLHLSHHITSFNRKLLVNYHAPDSVWLLSGIDIIIHKIPSLLKKCLLSRRGKQGLHRWWWCKVMCDIYHINGPPCPGVSWEQGKSSFGVGRPGGLYGEGSLLTALGEEAGFGPAEVWGHHPNTRAWKNSDQGEPWMSGERMWKPWGSWWWSSWAGEGLEQCFRW